MQSIVYWHGDKLYLNITNQCPNHCYFCFRNFLNGVWGFDLKLKIEPTFNEIIKELKSIINKRRWKEVVFCGFGEPTKRLDCLLKVTQWIKKYHGDLVRLDTNGQAYLLNPRRNIIDELKEAGLDRVSVSLNAHNKEVYNKICKPKFENAYESVLKFIEKSKKRLSTEITAVTIPEVNIKRLEEMAKKMGIKFRSRTYEGLC